jgi:hypothetical protein
VQFSFQDSISTLIVLGFRYVPRKILKLRTDQINFAPAVDVCLGSLLSGAAQMLPRPWPRNTAPVLILLIFLSPATEEFQMVRKPQREGTHL